MPREILIANRYPRLRLDRRAVAKLIHTLDTRFDVPPTVTEQATGKSKVENHKSKIGPGELSLVFLTDPALAQLHADFLDDPSPTDVITFAGDPAQGTAGEICVSVDAVLRQASSLAPRLSTLGFSTELTLYLVHGWLHLAGFDDLEPAKKRQMRRAETKALKLIREANVPPPFSLLR